MKTTSQYATDYNAGDAFIAGHFAEYVEGNKKHFTKSQLAHIAATMANAIMEALEDEFDPDKMARHLNLVCESVEQKKEAK